MIESRPIISPTGSTATEFLRALWPQPTPRGEICVSLELRDHPDARPARTSYWVPLEEIDQIEMGVLGAAEHSAPLFFTPCLFDKELVRRDWEADESRIAEKKGRPERQFPGYERVRGRNIAATALGCVFADLDFCREGSTKPKIYPTETELLDVLYAFLPPSVLVWTGHGYHAYWLLEHPIDLATPNDRAGAAALLKGFQAQLRARVKRATGKTIDNTATLARLLRLPGTRNEKWHVEVQVVRLDADRRWSAEQLMSVANVTQSQPCTNSRVSAAILAIEQAGEGRRNSCLNKHAFLIGQFVGAGLVDREVVEPQLLAAGLTTGLPAHEVADVVRRALDAGEGNPLSSCDLNPLSEVLAHPTTDSGNAERLVDWFGRDLRFCARWDKWLFWDGRRWLVGAKKDALHASKLAARRFGELARSVEDEDLRNHLISWSKSSESSAHRMAAVGLAAAEPTVRIDHESLDRDPWLFNCRNGTLDLTCGELRPHRREDLLTRLSPIEYHADAVCPTWNRFLTDVLPNPEVRAFLQRAVGWSLTGDVSPQAFLFLYGTGANGKSVFINIVCSLLGIDYAVQLAHSVLLDNKHTEHPTSIASLKGARMAIASELPPRQRFNEALLKRLTGGDRLTARRMREDYWDFDPTHTIWIAGNHRPAIHSGDRGIWRRVLLVPFEITIPESEQDRSLLDRLRAELPGIFAWAANGAIEYREHGLMPPDAISTATADYKEDEDRLADAFELCFERRPGLKTPFRDLYAAYCNLCDRTLEPRVSKKAFGQMLEEHGFKRYRSGSTRGYEGLGLRFVEGPIANGPTGERQTSSNDTATAAGT